MSNCRTRDFDSVGDARSVSRQLRIKRNLDTTPAWCEDCQAYHLKYIDSRLKKMEREILFKIAQGLTEEDIQKDLGVTRWVVRNHVNDMLGRMGALNRSNLVAMAIWLGIIDVTPIVQNFEVKERHHGSE